MSQAVIQRQEAVSGRPARIFFATPAYGGAVCAEYKQSMAATERAIYDRGDGWGYYLRCQPNDSLICRARNVMVAEFLAMRQQLPPDCRWTHLMFIDADIQWPAEAIFALLEADKDVICAPYTKKALPARYVMNFRDTENVQVWSPDGNIRHPSACFEVLDGGTGFMLIKAHVFERMKEAYFPDLKIRPNFGADWPATDDRDEEVFRRLFEMNYYAFFDTMLDREGDYESHRGFNYLSEDYTFCRLWQRIGGEVWMAPNHKLVHWGRHGFAADPEQIIGLLEKKEKQ